MTYDIRCAGCGYMDEEDKFNNNLCPRCSSNNLYTIKNNNGDKE